MRGPVLAVDDEPTSAGIVKVQQGARASPTEPPAPPSHVQRLPPYLLFVTGLAAFLLSAGALVAPQVTGLVQHVTAAQQPITAAAAPLSATELQTVLSFVQQMRDDDALVQVRPGVFAKRSNVEGVPGSERTVFYDLLPHQSFGPLRSGRVAESRINVLARLNTGDAQVLIYTLKEGW